MSKIKVFAALTPQGSEQESALLLSPSFWWSVAVFGPPWPLLRPSDLCLLLHMGFPLWVSFAPFYKDQLYWVRGLLYCSKSSS